MPSAVPSKLTKQPSMTASAGDSPASFDAAQAIAQTIENKIRNLEKRKAKLDSYDQDLKKGRELSKDQKEAVSHLGEVEQQLESMKDLLKTVNDYVKQQNKQKKAEKKAERAERVQSEMAHLRDLLHIQDILSCLGSESMRKDFLDGTNGAIKLTDDDFQKLDELYRKLCPSHEDLTEGQNWSDILNESSLATYSFLTNSSNAVTFCEGKTYRDFRALFDKIANCGYFDSKFGRSQSPEQAKSEAASTISNADDNPRVGGEKIDEKKPAINVVESTESGNLRAFNGGSGMTGGGGGGSVALATTSPPRQCSPSDLIAQSGQTNISFLQEDQSGGGGYNTNNANFEGSAMNVPLPYNEPVAFVNSNLNEYSSSIPANSALLYNQQQPNVSSAQLGGYTLSFDPGAQVQLHMGAEQIPMKPLDPNAPTFVSQADAVYASTLVSASSQMQQEQTAATQYFTSAMDEQRLSQEPIANELVPPDGSNDGFSHEHSRDQRFNRYGGGPRGRGGGFRGGDRGGYNTGRGRFGGGGYRGGRSDGVPGSWNSHDGGYRGRGGGYRSSFRGDESGRGGRGGSNAAYGRRGGGGFDQRGGRGGGGGYQRGGGRGGNEA